MGKWINGLADGLLQAGLSAKACTGSLRKRVSALGFGQLHYLQRTGKGGEAVLLLHGATADSSVWLPFVAHLRSGGQVLIPDLPGHGKSTVAPNLDYSTLQQARRLLDWLDHLNLARVHLIGHAMGGGIALRMAVLAPERVATLTLIDAIGTVAHESWLQEQIALSGRNPLLDVENAEQFRQMVQIGVARPVSIPNWVAAARARRLVARKAINARITQDLQDGLVMETQLAQIRQRTLIIWGRQDRILHVDNAARMRQLLCNSRSVVLDACGHAPMLESPKEVAGHVWLFLQEVVRYIPRQVSQPAEPVADSLVM